MWHILQTVTNMAALSTSTLIDKAIADYGGADWTISPVISLSHTIRTTADISDPISIDEFVEGALRGTTGARRTRMLFDVQKNVAEFPQLASITGKLQAGLYTELPPGVKPGRALPADAKMGVVVVNNLDGSMTTMKVYFFEGSDPATLRDVIPLLTGTGYIPVFRPGPWALKKGLLHLVDRIVGFHVHPYTLIAKAARGSSGGTWTVQRQARRDGVEFINVHCPEENDKNQQWLWIQESIEVDSGTPIAGWPEFKVQRLAENKTKGSNAAAKVEHFFPLCTCDLHPMWDKLLHFFYPLLPEYGLMMLGLPGVGKTPAFIAIAMAMGRYWCRTRPTEVNGPPGWRRGKQMDNFNKRPQQIQEAVFLDDPDLSSIALADIKALFESSEHRTVHARYYPAKLCKNGVVGCACNDFEEDDEPGEDSRTEITYDEGMKILRKPFEGAKNAHIMAVLKRTICVVVGQHAVYVRFPGASVVQIVHRIARDNFHCDWLKPDNKPYYGKYKRGLHEEYPDFESAIDREQAALMNAMAARGSMSPDSWIHQCNSDLQFVLRSSPPPVARHVAATPEDPDVETFFPDERGHYRIPIIRTPAATSTKRSRFRLPGDYAAPRVAKPRLAPDGDTPFADGTSNHFRQANLASSSSNDDAILPEASVVPEVQPCGSAANSGHQLYPSQGITTQEFMQDECGELTDIMQEEQQEYDPFGHGGSLDQN